MSGAPDLAPPGTPGKKPPAWIERTYLTANTDGHVPQAATIATADKDQVARLQACRETPMGRRNRGG
jgi:hypothetical protein